MSESVEPIPSDEIDPQRFAQQPAPLAISADMIAPPVKVDKRIDFERGMRYGPPLTLLLIAVNVAVFIWELSIGALESRDSIIAAGALWKMDVLEGQVWRLFTAMFLHGGFDHLIGNCMVLYVLGMACEHGFGAWRAGAIYLLSGLAGSAMSLAMTTGPSVGASGAIFGLCGAVSVFFLRYHKTFFLRDKRVSIVLIVWAAWSIATGFLSPEIDNFAHIGGFVGGAVVAAIVPRRDRPELTEPFAVVMKRPAAPASNPGRPAM